MPKEMDTAFFDRIHAYLPGWELGKTRDEMYTNHFGFVSDYLAEVFHNLRKSHVHGRRGAVRGVRSATSAGATPRRSARPSAG